MLILPLIYIVLILGVGWACYWWATDGGVALMFSQSRPTAIYVRSVLYLVPIVAGLILIVFMIRPLVVPLRGRDEPVVVSPSAESLLYTFVYRLCDLLGAPRPCRIDVDCNVNASAGFRGGIISMFRRDMVLTIGLPLVASLDLNQFAGILAHELGHFAQGSAMRLSHFIRSINSWFARAVYERGRLDQALNDSSDAYWGIAVTSWVARLFLWITRRVLSMLMMVGHAVSSALMRQMEFNADLYEIRVGGSDSFERVSNRLPVLSAATFTAYSDLAAAWREGRLPEDLPALIASREADVRRAARNDFVDNMKSRPTRWFDTHPSLAQRIERARLASDAGVFKLDLPATALFHDFPGICRRASLQIYCASFGGKFKTRNIVATESVVEQRVEQTKKYESARRFFQDLLDAQRPVYLPPSLPHIDSAHAAAEVLLRARGEFLAKLPAARSVLKEFEKSRERRNLIDAVRMLRAIGINNAGLGDKELARADEGALRLLHHESTTNGEAQQKPLDDALAGAMERLQLGLAIHLHREKADNTRDQSDDESFGAYDLADDAPVGSAQRLMDALLVMKMNHSRVTRLSQLFLELTVLIASIDSDENPHGVRSAIAARSERAWNQLRDIRESLGDTRYPFNHPERGITLSRFICGETPSARDAVQIQRAASATRGNFYSLYVRLMSDLAQCAESVETSLGLPPLEMPSAPGN